MRIRNPRYAPEFLERKLSPSALAPAPVAAAVYLAPTDAPPPPPNYPVPPSLPEPIIPVGPSGPCCTAF
jgi:hypothetical protein